MTCLCTTEGKQEISETRTHSTSLFMPFNYIINAHKYVRGGSGDLSVRLFKLTVFCAEEAQPVIKEGLVAEFNIKLCKREKMLWGFLSFVFIFKS